MLLVALSSDAIVEGCLLKSRVMRREEEEKVDKRKREAKVCRVDQCVCLCSLQPRVVAVDSSPNQPDFECLGGKLILLPSQRVSHLPTTTGGIAQPPQDPHRCIAARGTNVSRKAQRCTRSTRRQRRRGVRRPCWRVVDLHFGFARSSADIGAQAALRSRTSAATATCTVDGDERSSTLHLGCNWSSPAPCIVSLSCTLPPCSPPPFTPGTPPLEPSEPRTAASEVHW